MKDLISLWESFSIGFHLHITVELPPSHIVLYVSNDTFPFNLKCTSEKILQKLPIYEK